MSTGVSVTYIFNDPPTPSEATVEVLVSLGSSGPQTTVALPQLTKGAWTVTWELTTTPEITNAQFNPTDGIQIVGKVPANLHPTSQGASPNGLNFVIDFTNDVDSANSCQYHISGTSDQGRFSLDPTLAVTPDPPP